MPREGETPLKPKRPSSYWDRIFSLIDDTVKGELPSVSEIERVTSDPFHVLISTIISLRTKDEVTLAASHRLFARADTVRTMSELSEEELARMIYPAGFYRTKAKNIIDICHILLSQYNGQVPPDKNALMALPGVGLKTTNLVLSKGFGIPAICVDIHVHRISNRMGWVDTRTPDTTEKELREMLPLKYWIPVNEWLVLFGQQVCRPLSPYCSLCSLREDCPRIGVNKSR